MPSIYFKNKTIIANGIKKFTVEYNENGEVEGFSNIIQLPEKVEVIPKKEEEFHYPATEKIVTAIDSPKEDAGEIIGFLQEEEITGKIYSCGICGKPSDSLYEPCSIECSAEYSRKMEQLRKAIPVIETKSEKKPQKQTRLSRIKINHLVSTTEEKLYSYIKENGPIEVIYSTSTLTTESLKKQAQLCKALDLSHDNQHLKIILKAVNNLLNAKKIIRERGNPKFPYLYSIAKTNGKVKESNGKALQHFKETKLNSIIEVEDKEIIQGIDRNRKEYSPKYKCPNCGSPGFETRKLSDDPNYTSVLDGKDETYYVCLMCSFPYSNESEILQK